MTAVPPLAFRYQDGKMVPRSRAQADRHYADGETYMLEEYHARSMNSHAHYFASLHEAWLNLPESIAAQYPTETHFRKKLLIQAGYANEHHVVFSTENDAIKASALALDRDDYCVANVEGRVLTIWTAKSQSMKAMGKKDFEDSKRKVLEIAASLIGVKPEDLSQPQSAAG